MSGKTALFPQIPGPKQGEPVCIACGACMAVCPLLAATQREELSPRAKGLLARRLISESKAEVKDVRRLLRACLGCGRCADACPQGIDVPTLASRAACGSRDFQTWATGRLLGENTQGRFLREMGRKLLSDRSCGGQKGAIVLRPRPKPIPAERVTIFSGCGARILYGNWSTRATDLIKATGATFIDEPDWPCCGLPLRQTGLIAESTAVAEAVLGRWRTLGRPVIMTFCASCHRTLAAYEPGLFESEGEEKTWTTRLMPLSALLTGTEVQIRDDARRNIVFHSPCHERGFAPWHAHLQGGTGIAALDACCGFGGGLRMRDKALCRAVADRFWDLTGLQEGGTVLTACSGCVLQLSSTSPGSVSVLHWLDAVKRMG